MPVEQILVCLTRVAYSIAIVVTQASYEASLSRHETSLSVLLKHLACDIVYLTGLGLCSILIGEI